MENWEMEKQKMRHSQLEKEAKKPERVKWI